MQPYSKTEIHECLRMPELLDEIFEKDIPGIAADTRTFLRSAVSNIDGSGPGKGMTCIAPQDVPPLVQKIFHGVDQRMFDYDPGLTYQNSLRAMMHRMDRSCYECSRQDCENQVALGRTELLRVIFFGQSPDFRKVKTDPRFAGKGLKPSCDY